MAEALRCADCENELLPGAKFCSKCGLKVKETGTPVHCVVCGHENTGDAAFCEACGTALQGKSTQGASQENIKGRTAVGSGSKIEFKMWHYVVGLFVAALAGMFVYLELQRESEIIPSQAGLSSQGAATHDHSAPLPKELQESIDRLQKTVTENPADAGAKLLLANALHDGGIHEGSLFPQAIKAYQEYLKIKPGDPNARVDLGICYFELGKLDSQQSAKLFSMAIAEMETAVKGTPTHQAGAFNLGIVYLYSGNMKESNKWFKRAVELNAKSDLGLRAKSILEQHNQEG